MHKVNYLTRWIKAKTWCNYFLLPRISCFPSQTNSVHAMTSVNCCCSITDPKIPTHVSFHIFILFLIFSHFFNILYITYNKHLCTNTYNNFNILYMECNLEKQLYYTQFWQRPVQQPKSSNFNLSFNTIFLLFLRSAVFFFCTEYKETWVYKNTRIFFSLI